MSVNQVLPGASSLAQEYRPQNINCRNYICSLSRKEALGRIFSVVVSAGYCSCIGGAISFSYNENFALGAGMGAALGFVGTSALIYLEDVPYKRINHWMRGELEAPISLEENL